MKRDTDKQIDDLFKNSLAEPQHNVVYREEDWDTLEYRLNGAQRKKVVALWLPIMSAAAVLLIAIGWWLFAPMAVKKDQPQMASVQKTLPSTSDNKADKQVTGKHQVNAAVASTSPVSSVNTGSVAKTIPTQRNKVSHRINNASVNAPLQIAANVPPATAQPGVNGNAAISENVQQAGSNAGQVLAPVTNAQPAIAANSASTQASLQNTQADSIIKANNKAEVIAAAPIKINRASSSFRPQFAVSVMGAPEINGLGAMLDVRSGVNVGMLFSVSVKNLRLSTGANYSVKHYGSTYDPGTYMTVARGYSEASVSSKLMDIPLNLDYMLFNKSQNKFSVGAGLSSYIMWDQNYRYDYVDADFAPTEIVNREASRYFMSTLNLQMTYTRQLSPKFGLSFQPYFKVPLKQIGDSQSRLQTAGLAVGVNWYLNPLKKR